MRALLFSSDLMLISSVQGIANRHGVELVIASMMDAAVNSSAGAQAMAIDLRTQGLQLTSLVPSLRARAPGATLLAFGPHVQTEALAEAAAAGCDEVVTRGQFERRFDALLAALTATAAKDQH